MKHYGRHQLKIGTGMILVGSDAHYWPGKKASTAHRAFVKFAKEMKPHSIIMNGDVIDASTISSHPPIGWENFPTVKQEIVVADQRLSEIYDASPKSHRIWTLGNHDARYNKRLASVASEYKGVYGTKLSDHFPDWTPAWSVEVGSKVGGAFIKHRFKGGMNAAKNNALWSGRTTVTGHLHRLGISGVTDYSGSRWGIEGGMLGEPSSVAFKGYTEDNPLDWQPGFVVLTFVGGKVLLPEIAQVVGQGKVQFRGAIIKV